MAMLATPFVSVAGGAAGAAPGVTLLADRVRPTNQGTSSEGGDAPE